MRGHLFCIFFNFFSQFSPASSLVHTRSLFYSLFFSLQTLRHTTLHLTSFHFATLLFTTTLHSSPLLSLVLAPTSSSFSPPSAEQKPSILSRPLCLLHNPASIVLFSSVYSVPCWVFLFHPLFLCSLCLFLSIVCRIYFRLHSTPRPPLPQFNKHGPRPTLAFRQVALRTHASSISTFLHTCNHFQWQPTANAPCKQVNFPRHHPGQMRGRLLGCYLRPPLPGRFH